MSHNKYNVHLAGFLVTRVKEKNALKCMNKIAKGWSGVHNYNKAVNVRIWILRKPSEFDVQILKIHEQYVHCHVQNKHYDFKCSLTAVYGKNAIEERRCLWDSLGEIHQSIQGPWFITADFNAIMKYDDRIHGALVQYTEIRDLK